MPARDRYHGIVVRRPIRAGCSIIKEQVAVVLTEDEDIFDGCSRRAGDLDRSRLSWGRALRLVARLQMLE